MAKSNENEIAFFFEVTPETVGFFRQCKDYLIITQSEVYSNTEKNLRITNRVRRTETLADGVSESIIFEGATKYRLPLEGGVSRAIELEKIITEDEYKLALPFGEKIYQKRRFCFELGGFEADLDWYFERPLNDYGNFCKLDINVPEEGLSVSKQVTLLKLLPSLDITIKELVNPPWIFKPAIKAAIDNLMQNQWNLST